MDNVYKCLRLQDFVHRHAKRALFLWNDDRGAVIVRDGSHYNRLVYFFRKAIEDSHIFVEAPSGVKCPKLAGAVRGRRLFDVFS